MKFLCLSEKAESEKKMRTNRFVCVNVSQAGTPTATHRPCPPVHLTIRNIHTKDSIPLAHSFQLTMGLKLYGPLIINCLIY
jgi:hypothetical protein